MCVYTFVWKERFNEMFNGLRNSTCSAARVKQNLTRCSGAVFISRRIGIDIRYRGTQNFDARRLSSSVLFIELTESLQCHRRCYGVSRSSCSSISTGFHRMKKNPRRGSRGKLVRILTARDDGWNTTVQLFSQCVCFRICKMKTDCTYPRERQWLGRNGRCCQRGEGGIEKAESTGRLSKRNNGFPLVILFPLR